MGTRTDHLLHLRQPSDKVIILGQFYCDFFRILWDDFTNVIIGSPQKSINGVVTSINNLVPVVQRKEKLYPVDKSLSNNSNVIQQYILSTG